MPVIVTQPPLTEEAAKTKVCPFLQRNCIASECAMWRRGAYEVYSSQAREPQIYDTGYCSIRMLQTGDIR